MVVNPINNLQNLTEISIILNKGAISEIDKLTNEKTENIKTSRGRETSSVQRALEQGNSLKTSATILANLAVKLAQSGFELNPDKILGSRKSELEEDLIYGNNVSYEDKVDLKELEYKILRKGEKRNKEENSEKQESINTGRETAGTLKEYASVYTQMLVSGNSDLKKKLDELENKLKSSGVTEKELGDLRAAIAKSLRGEIAEAIRQALIGKVLSSERSFEGIIAGRAVNDIIDFAFFNPRIGGWDFGGYNMHLQGTVDRLMGEIGAEMRDFIPEELERILIKRLVNGETDEGSLIKDIKDLLKLAQKVGFDLDSFLEKWKIKKFDLGFVPFEGGMLSKDGKSSSGGRRGEYEFTKEDEKEILINQLRALYMKRALNPGNFLTILETSFKMRKTKNGLIKLGVQIDDFGKVEREGRELAKVRLFKMLEEALDERGTHYELSGPSYKLVEKKVKGLLSNLEKLGIEVSSDELKLLIDRSNRRMHAEATDELEVINNILKVQKNPYLDQKRSQLTKLLSRLGEESNIREAV